jgi:chorismate lyase / 3-hydroxybenzoate synthase
MDARRNGPDPLPSLQPLLADLAAAPLAGDGYLLGGAVFSVSSVAAPTASCLQALQQHGAVAGHVGTPGLADSAGCTELWRVSSGPVRHGAQGPVHFACNDEVLLAHAALAESDASAVKPASEHLPEIQSSLRQVSREAYRALFATLDAQGFPYPMRFWNYLPHINADEALLERYRHFNVGRHDAFVDANRSPGASPPAACALGTAGGALTVMVLAGRTPPSAIENPRQVSAYRYPHQYGPRSPAFSRASLARVGNVDLLLVSGTASIVGHETLHRDDVQAQVEESLRNVAAVVAAANAALGRNAFSVPSLQMKGYVRHAADAPRVRATLARLLPGVSVHLVRADICRAELLFEIEATGCVTAPAR